MEANGNRVELCGQIVEEFEFDHEVFHEKFYRTIVRVERNSGIADFIPILVSDKILDLSCSWLGAYIELHGQYRSWTRYCEDGTRKLELNVFVEYGDGIETLEDKNYIEIDGYVVKEPTFRKTYGGKDIADVMLVVNRAYGKKDYIPLIMWGRNAAYASTLEVGTHLGIIGRIQSREYVKRLSETESETRIAYEVSVQSVWEV